MKTLLFFFAMLIATLTSLQATEVVWPRHAQPIFDQAFKSIPYAREFRELYPNASMGFFDSADGLHLYLYTGLFQRYLASLNIPLKLTADGRAIKSWSEPYFELEDVGEITVAEDGQGHTVEGNSVQKWGYDRFKILKEHGGDFTAIGIELVRDQPRKDFDRVWRPDHPDYVLRPFTFSPLRRYGVQVPIYYDEGTDDEDPRKNRVVEVDTGRLVAVIRADPGYNRALNFHEVARPRWSPDESLLLWKVAGKWSPDALVILKLHRGQQEWQLDLLKTAQRALLVRTRKAAPKTYLKAKRANAGNGSAFPDGFTVDVHTDGEDGTTVSLPLQVHVDLTANPKAIEHFPANLESYLDAVVTKDGQFIVTRFRLSPREER